MTSFTASEFEKWEHENIYTKQRLNDAALYELYSKTEPEWLTRHIIISKYYNVAAEHKQNIIVSIEKEISTRENIHNGAMAVWQGLVQNPSLAAWIIDFLLPEGISEMLESVKKTVENQQIAIDTLTEKLEAVRNRPIISFIPELYGTSETLTEGLTSVNIMSDYVEYTKTKIPYKL